MKQVKYFCSTNYQLNEILLCAETLARFHFRSHVALHMGLFVSQLGSAHVPVFSKNFVVFFKEFDGEINYQDYGGCRIQLERPYFLPQYQEMQLPSSHLLLLYSSTLSASHRYSYKPRYESAYQTQDFLMPSTSGKKPSKDASA